MFVDYGSSSDEEGGASTKTLPKKVITKPEEKPKEEVKRTTLHPKPRGGNALPSVKGLLSGIRDDGDE